MVARALITGYVYSPVLVCHIRFRFLEPLKWFERGLWFLDELNEGVPGHFLFHEDTVGGRVTSQPLYYHKHLLDAEMAKTVCIDTTDSRTFTFS